MEFENLDQLKEIFTRRKGEFTFPEEIVVAGIKYKSGDTSSYSMLEIMEKNYKPMWVYGTSYREQARAAGLDQHIVLLWGFYRNSYAIAPYDVRTLSTARLGGQIIKEQMDNGDSVNIQKDRIIGDVVDVMITSLPGTRPIKGKIDTGADVSSLHADKWEISNGQVTFMAPDISENQITMPVIEKQTIKLSNGDTEFRPVIELNIKINNQELTNCMFNLNDRGAMTYSILIGQNVLEAGEFIIDPTINDPDAMANEDVEIDWESIQEEFKDDVLDGSTINTQNIQKVIDFINEIENK